MDFGEPSKFSGVTEVGVVYSELKSSDVVR